MKEISNLYVIDQYTNPNIPFLFNTEIMEYDMQEAGFSLIREFKQLPEDVIKKLNSISSKDERKVAIGNLERGNPEFKKKHLESFISARKMFFIANDITDDNDIIAIKKDALFINRKCKETKIGNYINFREKNKYSSFIRLNKKLEFYYSPKKLDIKGLNDENYIKHENGMIKFIKSFFYKMETEDQITVLDYLRNFISRYKRYELDIDYYRTFDHKSCFVTKKHEEFDEYWEEHKRELDINLNYNLLILFCKILI